MDDMIQSFAVKLAVIGITATISGVGIVAAQIDNATEGSVQGWVFLGGGFSVTAAAMALLVRLARMFADGSIVSKPTDAREAQLTDALAAMTVALETSTLAWKSANESAMRREEALERIVNAYLPHFPD